jgi:hypothetical protein
MAPCQKVGALHVVDAGAIRCATSSHKSVGAACEQVLHGNGAGNDVLRLRVPNKIFDDLPIRGDAVGQRFARDVHHPLMNLVDAGRAFDLARLAAVDIEPFRRGEGASSPIRGMKDYETAGWRLRKIPASS